MKTSAREERKRVLKRATTAVSWTSQYQKSLPFLCLYINCEYFISICQSAQLLPTHHFSIHFSSLTRFPFSWWLFPNGMYVCRLTTRFPTSMHNPQGCSFTASFFLPFFSSQLVEEVKEKNWIEFFFVLLFIRTFFHINVYAKRSAINNMRERVRDRQGSERGKVLA